MSFGGGGTRLKNHIHSTGAQQGGTLSGEHTGVTIRGKIIPMEAFV